VEGQVGAVGKTYAISGDLLLMAEEYLPVEGCEECEFFETACIECILYGEAKKVKKDADEER